MALYLDVNYFILIEDKPSIAYCYSLCFVLYIYVTVNRNIYLLNNQSNALIIQMYSVIKLYMFRAFLCPSKGVFYCIFGIYQCRMYSRKLLMMGREDARNM